MTKLLILLTLFSNIALAAEYIDQRPGANNQSYGTRIINNLVWQESNASFPVAGSLCHGGGDHCPEMGRLYTLEQAQLACDNNLGWRVASDQDWMRLETALGMASDQLLINAYAGRRGTDEGRQLMEDPNFGFSIASGYFARGQFLGINDGDDRSYFWSVAPGENYFRRNLRVNTTNIHRFSNGLGDFQISVRCVKDFHLQ